MSDHQARSANEGEGRSCKLELELELHIPLASNLTQLKRDLFRTTKQLSWRTRTHHVYTGAIDLPPLTGSRGRSIAMQVQRTNPRRAD